MTEVPTQEASAPPSGWSRITEISREVHRGFIAEWTVTIILLLFATTTLVQAFVIPSASMQNTLLIGDHVLVDKLTYAPQGSISKHLLPYRDIRRGDIIVFRYPRNVGEDYVKRAIGLPGDHIKLVNKQLWLNGHFVNEPYVVHSSPYIDTYRDNFPTAPEMPAEPSAADMLQNHVVNGELVAIQVDVLIFEPDVVPGNTHHALDECLLDIDRVAEHDDVAALDLAIGKDEFRRRSGRRVGHLVHQQMVADQ